MLALCVRVSDELPFDEEAGKRGGSNSSHMKSSFNQLFTFKENLIELGLLEAWWVGVKIPKLFGEQNTVMFIIYGIFDHSKHIIFS